MLRYFSSILLIPLFCFGANTTLTSAEDYKFLDLSDVSHLIQGKVAGPNMDYVTPRLEDFAFLEESRRALIAIQGSSRNWYYYTNMNYVCTNKVKTCLLRQYDFAHMTTDGMFDNSWGTEPGAPGEQTWPWIVVNCKTNSSSVSDISYWIEKKFSFNKSNVEYTSDPTSTWRIQTLGLTASDSRYMYEDYLADPQCTNITYVSAKNYPFRSGMSARILQNMFKCASYFQNINLFGVGSWSDLVSDIGGGGYKVTYSTRSDISNSRVSVTATFPIYQSVLDAQGGFEETYYEPTTSVKMPTALGCVSLTKPYNRIGSYTICFLFRIHYNYYFRGSTTKWVKVYMSNKSNKPTLDTLFTIEYDYPASNQVRINVTSENTKEFFKALFPDEMYDSGFATEEYTEFEIEVVDAIVLCNINWNARIEE